MSMNAVVISLFLGGLALCIVTGASLLWALAFGLLCFTGHAFRLGFRPREIVGLCGRGVRTIGNILKIFVLRIPVLLILQRFISDGATALGIMMLISNVGVSIPTTIICACVSAKLLRKKD